ncbi:MAG: PASTA domain-containing protein, partial [Solobacterium sp.]|nr:PASTA domain-containing protein [Solobacterium sp.]
MKRIICFIVFVFLLVPLSACGQSGSSSKTKIKPVSVVNMPVEEAVKALQECGADNIVTDADQYEGWAPEKIIVTEQSVQEGKSISPDEEIRLTCRRLVRLYVDVKSESNLLFNTYDMDIYVDDHNLGTVKNGDSFTALAEVIEGSHEIYAYKSSNHSTSAYKQIDVNGDTTFSSRISHGGSIGFEESSVKEGILG